jgi:predicted TIM-barrel fold metal-dependent hydrolase
VDDERLAPLFEKAAELHVPIMFHIADPDAFFQPIDNHNERYEELAAHPEWSFHGSQFDKSQLLGQRDKVFARHPKTTFVAAHVAEHPEDLSYVSRLLDLHSNLYVDIGARCAELGRQPCSRVFPEIFGPHSLRNGPDSRRKHVSPSLSFSGNSRRVFRVPLACLSSRTLEHLRFVSSG